MKTSRAATEAHAGPKQAAASDSCGPWILCLAIVFWATILTSRSGLAQSVPFNYFAAPTLVASTGDAEVLGQIILSADSSCGTSADAFCISSAASIQVTFADMVIENTSASGITVCEILSGVTTCNAPGTYLDGSIAVGSSLAGGVVSFGVKAGANFAAGDQVRISGVRARITQTPLAVPGSGTTALLTAAPVIAAGFNPTSNLIARSADPLTVAVLEGGLVPCVPSEPAAVLEIREGFSTAFVDHADPGETTFPGAPANSRPPFGATNSSRVRVVLSGLVEGIALHWPSSVTAVNSAAVLDLVSQSEDGSTATYVFGTPDQAASDVLEEAFEISLTSANFTFSGHGPISGTVKAQGQMAPPASPPTTRPRYNHPLEPAPAEDLLALRRCNTTTGTLTIRADVDGLSWFGDLEFELSGPTPFHGTKVPVILEGMLAGSYTLQYLSGGPGGATFVGYSPNQSQTLTVEGTRLFTINFFGPTVASLQLNGIAAPVCPAADTVVGNFHLVNATESLQIIPGGTRFELTFSRPIVSPPVMTGLGAIQPAVSGAMLTFEIPGSISLPPGGALTFSGTRLNLASLGSGQNVTVQLATTPANAIQLASSQVAIAATNVSLCTELPSVTAEGVANGASLVRSISAGSIATIFGSRLSNVSGTVAATSLPLPVQLGGVSITVNGIAAPIFSVSNQAGAEQITFQVPWEVAGQSSVTIVVNKNGLTSNPVAVGLAPAAPGIFTTDGFNAAAVHGSTSDLVSASNPAVPGTTVVLYATGLGPVSPTLATGAAAPSSPPAAALGPTFATIAGLSATVLSAELVPGSVGLYRVNVQVPTNAPSGNQNVVIQVAGQSSQLARIAIQ